MQIHGEDVIHELVERKDNSTGRIWRFRFVCYKSGTASFPSYTVYLYHNGVLSGCATSADSFFMAALIVRDYRLKKLGTIEVFPTKPQITPQAKTLSLNDI